MNVLSEQDIDMYILMRVILERWRIIHRELEFINNHHNLVESTLATQIELMNSNLWKEVDAIECPDQADDIFQQLSSERYTHEHTYPNMHRSAMLLTLYSFFEYALALYCELLQKCLNISPQKVNGGNIKGYKEWLKSTVGVNFSATNPYWEEINYFRMLRNSIVHAYGDIGTNTTLESYIENSPHISFSDIGFGVCPRLGGGFELGSSFVGHATITIATFFEKLTDDIRVLFPLSETDIINALKQHFEAEAQLRKNSLEALDKNPSISDIMKHIL